VDAEGIGDSKQGRRLQDGSHFAGGRAIVSQSVDPAKVLQHRCL